MEQIIVDLDPALVSQLRAFMADVQGWDGDRCITFALLHWLQRQSYKGKDEELLHRLIVGEFGKAMAEPELNRIDQLTSKVEECLK